MNEHFEFLIISTITASERIEGVNLLKILIFNKKNNFFYILIVL